MSCGANWLGAIMVSEYVVRYGQNGLYSMEMGSSEESTGGRADVGDLPTTWGHDDVLAWAAKGHVWVDDHDSCSHQRL